MTDWICIKTEGLPNFNHYGFHVCGPLLVRYADGTEGQELYQGWGLWGVTNRQDITHWKHASGFKSDSPPII